MSIIERALAQVDRRGFDPAAIEEGERLLVEFADTYAVKDLRILAAQVIDRIDPDGTLPNDQLNHDRRHVEFHQRGDGSWAGTLRLTGLSAPNCRPCSDRWPNRGSTWSPDRTGG